MPKSADSADSNKWKPTEYFGIKASVTAKSEGAKNGALLAPDLLEATTSRIVGGGGTAPLPAKYCRLAMHERAQNDPYRKCVGVVRNGGSVSTDGGGERFHEKGVGLVR